MLNQVFNEDCLEGMKRIPAGSIDMILCDLPYGTTKNKWDSVIPFAPMWEQYWRVCKPNAAIVLTAQCPFDKTLGASQIQYLKYEWIWEKPQGTGHLNANKYPLKNHENILVFCKGLHIYNPQFLPGKPYFAKRGLQSSNYGKQVENLVTDNSGFRYPKTILPFTSEKGLHPTQKPVALFEYLIKTYTNEGDTILDNCMGSGTTAIACLNTGRNYIGFEKDPKYFDILQGRILKQTDPEAYAAFY